MNGMWKRITGTKKGFSFKNNSDNDNTGTIETNNDSVTVDNIMKPEKEGFLQKVSKSAGSGKKNLDYNKATVVRPKIVLRGDITGDEDIIIEGRIEGRVILKGDLYVAESGLIEADVDAKNVYIAGKINGNVYASQKIEIEASGILNGDIKCPKVIVTEGAVLRGNIDMNYEGLELAKKSVPGKKGLDDIIKLGPIRPGKPITLEDGKL